MLIEHTPLDLVVELAPAPLGQALSVPGDRGLRGHAVAELDDTAAVIAWPSEAQQLARVVTVAGDVVAGTFVGAVAAEALVVENRLELLARIERRLLAGNPASTVVIDLVEDGLHQVLPRLRVEHQSRHVGRGPALQLGARFGVRHEAAVDRGLR
jgi:hypothetical protein